MFSCSGLQKASIKIKMVTINIANKEFMKNIGYEIVGTGGGKVSKPTSVPSLPQGQHSSSWTACHPSCSSATRSTPGIRLKLNISGKNQPMYASVSLKCFPTSFLLLRSSSLSLPLFLKFFSLFSDIFNGFRKTLQQINT